MGGGLPPKDCCFYESKIMCQYLTAGGKNKSKTRMTRKEEETQSAGAGRVGPRRGFARRGQGAQPTPPRWRPSSVFQPPWLRGSGCPSVVEATSPWSVLGRPCPLRSGCPGAPPGVDVSPRPVHTPRGRSHPPPQPCLSPDVHLTLPKPRTVTLSKPRVIHVSSYLQLRPPGGPPVPRRALPPRFRHCVHPLISLPLPFSPSAGGCRELPSGRRRC